MTIVALLGAKALYFTYLWLLSAIAASFLSARKGYGEKPGLASGMLLPVVSVVAWLLWPAKPDSRWSLQGPLGRSDKSLAQLRAEREGTPPQPGQRP